MAAFTLATAPWKLPLIGHGVQLHRHPQDYLAGLHRYGDIVRIRAGIWDAYVICNPDLVHEMLTNDRTFDKGGRFFEEARDLGGNGLVTCPYRVHRRQRRLFQPLFTSAYVPHYESTVRTVVERFLDQWHHGQTVAVMEELFHLTSEISARCFFSSAYAIEGALTIAENLNPIFEHVYRRTIQPFDVLNKIPTRPNRDYQARARLVRGVLRRMVEEGRTRTGDHDDLLSLMLSALESDDAPITEQEVHDEVLAFLAGSIEAPAAVISWGVYEIFRNEATRRAVVAEVDSVLGDRRVATLGDLERLPRLKAVFAEILRMYPPPAILSRTTSEPVALGGHRLPQGATLIYSPYIVQRNSSVHERPYTFDPGRWADGMPSPSDHGMIPFGAGARKCIGEHFAHAEVLITLATVVRSFELRQVGNENPLKRNPGSTIPPSRLRMTIHRR